MICKKCGAEIKSGARFCPKCGETIVEIASSQSDVAVTAKKKPTRYIIIAVIAVIAVVLLIVGITACSKADKYMKIVKAYENTLNADSMIFEYELIEDEEINRGYGKAEIIGKGDDTAIAYYNSDGIYAAWDSDYVYYYNGEREDIDGKSDYKAAYNAVSERDMNYMYDYLDIGDYLGMSFDELYDACIGFVKDYYKNKDSIKVDCDVEDSDSSYRFELDIRDFINYVEKNHDYRMDSSLYSEIPEGALLIVELTLDGKYFSELKASLEYDHFRPFEASVKFSEVNEISEKNSKVRKYIDEFEELETNTYKNQDADSIQRAANSALTELDNEGYDIGETCTVSSDENKSYQCNTDVLSRFQNKAYNYFNGIDNYNYFIVCDRGVCVYAVVSDKNNSTLIGTYPENSLYKKNGDFESVDLSSYSYEDLYQLCLEEVMS